MEDTRAREYSQSRLEVDDCSLSTNVLFAGDRNYDRDARRRYEGDDRSKRRRGEDGDEDRHRRSYPPRRDYDYDRRPRRHDDYGGGRERDAYRRGGRDRYDYDRRGQDSFDHRRRDSGRERGSWRDGGAREPSPPVRRSATPPDTKPISERKPRNSKWGVTPQGFESFSALQAKSTGLFGLPGQARPMGLTAPGLARDEQGNIISSTSLPPIHIGDVMSIQGVTQSNRQARRLYVGNIGFSTNDDSLVKFFNQQMKNNNFTVEDGEPAIAAQINKEKGYAFVEFRSTTEATNAMSFDGIIYQGQSIKVRRPKDYMGPDPVPQTSVHVPGVVSTNVPDGPNKIYVGGLPLYLNEDQIVELLRSFGELRAFNLVRESGLNGVSKGFAFCEYSDASVTDLAIQGLNEMELGDKKLLVQRASVGSVKPMQDEDGTPEEDTPAPAPATGFSGPGEPTRAMMLLNCVTAEELVDQQEYQEIVEDMRDECGRYGTVVDMRIPRPQAASKGTAVNSWRQSKQDESKEREGVGRVYVMFEDTEACKKALGAIAGRQFAGRTVIAAFIPIDAFPADEDGGRDAEETTKQASGM